MENQREKFISNFFLLLKQGFKGIFKFRIQFIIILILSFLATFVLTISVSTSRRLESAYQNVVKKIDPFDFMGTTKVSDTAISNAGGANMQDFRSTALTDFLNDTFVNAVGKDDKTGQITNTSSYNFIFNQQAYQDVISHSQTFLTKVIDSQADDSFYQLTLNYYNKLSELSSTNQADGEKLLAIQKTYKWELKESFTEQLIKDLIAYRNNPQDVNVAYLGQTSFGFLLKNDPQFFDFVGPRFVKGHYYNFNPDQQRFIRYLYWIGAQIATWIFDQEWIFGSGAKNDESIFKDVASTPTEKAEVFYEFLTGKKYGDLLQPRFVIGEENPDTSKPNLAYTLETKYYEPWDDANKDKYLIVDKGEQITPFVLTDNQRKDLTTKKGYRGITSPLSIKVREIAYLPGEGEVDPYQGIIDVTFTQNYEEFSLLDRTQAKPLTRLLNLDNDFSYNYDIMNQEDTAWNPNENASTKASMLQYHLELNSLSAGFNARFRKESIVFDNISSKKFRFVILNGRDDANFTILRGTAPTAANEIAISQQFAQANKIKVGQYLTIGHVVMMVTGFATDAFTFFPNVDPDFPVPQPKTEAIIYGSKASLTKIHSGNGEGTPQQNTDPQMFSFFLTNNKKENLFDLPTKKNLFISLQMDLASNLKNNFTYLKNLTQTQVHQQNLVADEVTPTPLASFFSLKSFQESNYRLSWTLLPIVLNTFQIVTYLASAIIALIAIIALVICIRKTIHFNSKQIGILKAMGTNPWMIAVTYLAHSLVIMTIIVPVAWIIGTGLQIPFSLFFTQYFSAPTNIVLVDWISILTAFFGFGIVAIVTSMVAAYLVTKKPVVEIIDHSVKWSHSKIIDRLKAGIFKNASFNYRFSLTLSSSGKKPIALLVTVVGLTSLLISGAIAVPAVADKVISSYYKSVNYANAYDNMTPTVNSPLSKTVLNFWKGNEKWDQDWKDANLKLDATSTPYGYYLDPDGYMDSASQASPIPKYMFFKDDFSGSSETDIVQNFTYSYAYLLKNPNLFLNLATEIFGNNYFTVLGQTFNIGTVDQFFGLILNSDFETIKQLMGGFKDAGGKYDPNLSLDANKQQLAFEFSGALTMALPNIISVIFTATSGSTPEPGKGNDWKNDVINAILTQVPPYVRNYIEKSSSRKEQFGISFNAEPYVPKRESFVTKFTASTNERNNVQFIGIDDNQNAFTIGAEANKRLFLDANALSKVEKIINGQGNEVSEFWANGIKVWDGVNLTLPMLDNHQSAAGYKLNDNGVLSNIATTTRQLKYHTNEGNSWKVLPKNAWAYDDSDFQNSDLYQTPLETLKLKGKWPGNFNERYQESAQYNSAYTPENNHQDQTPSSWLDVYAIENSRFTYQKNFDQEQKLKNKTYFFNDFTFDNQNQISSSYTRPYYQYQNIELFLPTELINEEDILNSSTHSSKIPEGTWYYHTNNQAKLKLENGVEVTNEYAVPDSVLNAWGLTRETKKEFLVIRPYDLRYGEKGESGRPLDRLFDGINYPYWLRYAFDSDNGPGALTYNNEEPVVYANQPTSTPFKINFQVVGTLDSYDSQLLLIDQSLANMILGYSTARTVGASNTYLTNPQGPDTEHNQGTRPWKDQLNTFEFNRPQLDVLVQDNREKLGSLTYLKNLEDANNYQPLKWHTGKLSNVDEPVNLTSSVSFNVRDNLGQYALGLLYPLNLGMNPNVASQTLLSTQKALINQVYSLAIGLGALLIVAIVLTSSLLIMLVGDVYIAQYLRFMILMRALGYSNRAIQSYAFGTVTVLALATWIVVTFLTWLLIFAFIKLIETWGLAIPYGLTWWPILVSFIIVFISFFGSLLVSSGKVRRGEVADLVNESNE